MDNNHEQSPPKELCTIRIGFPVDSDEQAIEYKKKISAVFSELPAARIDFGLIPVPLRPENHA